MSSMKILERIVDSLTKQVVSIYYASRALSQKEHYICNRCGATNAGEMPNSDHIDFIWDNISCYRFYLPDYLP